MQKRIIKYQHYNVEVSVQEHLQGLHREHCLCHQNCAYFKPENREENCEIANANFENCIKYHVVLPVWECPKYRHISAIEKMVEDKKVINKCIREGGDLDKLAEEKGIKFVKIVDI